MPIKKTTTKKSVKGNTVTQGTKTSAGVVNFDPNTGKRLSAGQSVTVNPSAQPSGVPAYNAKTGKTTGKPSAEYDAYLKSLNKKRESKLRSNPRRCRV